MRDRAEGESRTKVQTRQRQLELLVFEFIRLYEMHASEDAISSTQWQLVHQLTKSLSHERDSFSGDKFDGSTK